MVAGWDTNHIHKWNAFQVMGTYAADTTEVHQIKCFVGLVRRLSSERRGSAVDHPMVVSRVDCSWCAIGPRQFVSVCPRKGGGKKTPSLAAANICAIPSQETEFPKPRWSDVDRTHFVICVEHEFIWPSCRGRVLGTCTMRICQAGRTSIHPSPTSSPRPKSVAR